MFNRAHKHFLFLIISLLCLCCKKPSQEQVEPPDPFIRDTLSGTYRFGIFSWEVTDANGYRLVGDTAGKVQVGYKGGKTVEITLISNKYPYKTDFTAELRDSTANGVKIYKYDHRFDSTATHWSEIHLNFRIFGNLNLFPPYLTDFFFFDYSMSNGALVSPSYNVHCATFSKQ